MSFGNESFAISLHVWHFGPAKPSASLQLQQTPGHARVKGKNNFTKQLVSGTSQIWQNRLVLVD